MTLDQAYAAGRKDERERAIKQVKLARSAFAGRMNQARYDRGTGVIALTFFDAAIKDIKGESTHKDEESIHYDRRQDH